MKVALALPPKQRLAQDQYNNCPQAGIAYVAGGLRKEKADVTIYNSKYRNIFEDDLFKILSETNYDILGFSAITIEIKSVARIANKLKSINKQCKIAIGGCHLNALPKETMEEFSCFDIGIIGEHEDQLFEIFSLLKHDDYNGLERFNNIIFKSKNELYYKNLNRRFIKEVNSIAWPAYELFGERSLSPSYVTVRGCPFRCLFCQQNSGRTLRLRSIDDVCDEIEYFSSYFNQNQFTFRDESFTANKKHTVALCNELIKRGLNNKLTWSCETHSRVADYELFCLMREAGCNYVDIGIESGDNFILKETGKNTTVEIIEEACQNVKKAKLKLGALNILGHPFETKKSILKTIFLSAKLNPDSVTFSMMTPFPGTKIFEYASQNIGGLRLLTKDWEKYDNISGYAMEWDNFSARFLKICQAFGVITYYFYNLRFKEFAKYLAKHYKGILAYFLSFFTRINFQNADGNKT